MSKEKVMTRHTPATREHRAPHSVIDSLHERPERCLKCGNTALDLHVTLDDLAFAAYRCIICGNMMFPVYAEAAKVPE